MLLNFLGRESITLAKTLTAQPDGTIAEEPYPLVKRFNSYEEDDVQDIHDLLYVLKQHAEAGNCLLNGTLKRPLRDESRAEQIDPLAPHPLLILDVDGIDEPGMVPDFAPVTRALGLDQFSHIIQYSSSMGLRPDKGPAAHLFFILAQPAMPHELKRWTLHYNLSLPLFTRHLSLNKASNGLKFALDPTSNENNRIIYIAPPILDGLDDPYEDRFILVEREQEHVPLDLAGLHGDKQLQQLKRDQVNRLRTENRLPPINVTTRTRMVNDEPVEYAANADPVRMTGHREARGFAYFNFNDGDSWAYYHPLESPEIIYNFKGEPNLLTREVLPEYYPQARKRAKEHIEELRREEERLLAEEAQRKTEATIEQLNEPHAPDRPPVPFVFTDGDTGKYRGGVHYPTRGVLELYNLSTIAQIEAFCAQHGIEVPAVIPTWKTTYNPTKPKRFLREDNQLNLYTPSLYRLNAQPGRIATCPETIHTLVRHVAGGSDEFADHFLNWLAFIWQTGRKPQTAFIFTGTTGTGKGTLHHHVLRPLLGESNVRPRPLDSFEKEFNYDLHKAQIMWIEESSTDGTGTPKKVAQRLLTLISDEATPLRRMQTDYETGTSYFGMIFSSNVVNVTIVEANDRRFNICPRQEKPLHEVMPVDEGLHDLLRDELGDFADYLSTRRVDEQAVRKPMWSDQKEAMIVSTTEVPQDVTNALLEGNFAYFFEQLPSDPAVIKDNLYLADNPALLGYIEVLDKIVDQYRQTRSEITLHRDDIQVLYRYCVGWDKQTKTRFTKAVSKYGLRLKQVWLPGKDGDEATTVPGIKIDLTIQESMLLRYQRFYSRQPHMKVVDSQPHKGGSHATHSGG